jgi:hypothetical protein
MKDFPFLITFYQPELTDLRLRKLTIIIIISKGKSSIKKGAPLFLGVSLDLRVSFSCQAKLLSHPWGALTKDQQKTS